MARKKSIMVNPEWKDCAICGSSRDPEWHHVMHGTANRKISDKWGLTVWLCHDCHEALHFSPDPSWRDRDKELMQLAQKCFERKYNSHEKWMELFGKNFIDTPE